MVMMRLLNDFPDVTTQAERGVQERKFSDLESLVKDYLTRRSRNGLMCALRHPVAIQEPLDDDSGTYITYIYLFIYF